MINREEAITALLGLIESGLLGEDIENDLRDIANCIDAEQDGIHLWGADDEEVTTLYTAVAEDTPAYDDFVAKCNDLYMKYHFGLSPFEIEKEKEGAE